MTTPHNGSHILLDLYGAKNLDNIDIIQKSLYNAAKACGATVLDINLHKFGHGGGVTGVAMLAESHITIHTWPEIGYAALDIFVCGKCIAENAVPILKSNFHPTHSEITKVRRGMKYNIPQLQTAS